MITFPRMRVQFLRLIDENGIGATPTQVTIRGLTSEEAIGRPESQDYPLLKGRERLVEAEILGSRGQAFTDGVGAFSGTLEEAARIDLADNWNRAVFIAALNALMRHLGLVEKTIHCKDSSPPLCALELLKHIRNEFGHPRVAMIGFQPRMVQVLTEHFPLRVTDLDEDNIGKSKFGVVIQGPEETSRNIAWCDVVLATGSTVVNDSMEELLTGKPTIFFGVTIAGPAALLGLNRYCCYGE